MAYDPAYAGQFPLAVGTASLDSAKETETLFRFGSFGDQR